MCAITATSTPSSPEKTLVLFGSPRKDGASAAVLALLCEMLEDVTVVDAYERAVTPCDDCRGCYSRVGCVKRDMEDVYEALEAASRLVIVTPVYNRSFPAPLKAMIDRLQCYWAARFIHGKRPPIASPRTATVITAAGSDREDGKQLLYQLEPALTVLHVTETNALHIQNTDRAVDIEQIRADVQSLIFG